MSLKTSQILEEKEGREANHVVQNSIMITDNVSDNHKIMIKGPDLVKSHQKPKLLKKKNNNRQEKLNVFNKESKSGKQFSFGTKEFKSKVSSAFKTPQNQNTNNDPVRWDIFEAESSQISFDNVSKPIVIIKAPSDSKNQHEESKISTIKSPKFQIDLQNIDHQQKLNRIIEEVENSKSIAISNLSNASNES